MMPSPPVAATTRAMAKAAAVTATTATTIATATTDRNPDHVQVFPPPQVLPLHCRRREGDRLQGSQHPASVRHREWQDRAEPHHRYQGALPAPAGHGDQARPFPVAAAVHRQPRRLTCHFFSPPGRRCPQGRRGAGARDKLHRRSLRQASSQAPTPHPNPLPDGERVQHLRTTVLWLRRATPVLTNRKASWNSFFCRKSATSARSATRSS